MDRITEKKWFVYMGDHHEGPFSLDELQGKMALRAISRENFVWAEGMPDWKIMTEVNDFAPLLRVGTQTRIPRPAPRAADTGVSPVLQVSSSDRSSTGIRRTQAVEAAVLDKGTDKGGMDKTGKMDISELKQIQELADAMDQQEKAKKPRFSTKRVAKWSAGFFGIIIGLLLIQKMSWMLKTPRVQASIRHLEELARPRLLGLADSLPFLQSWVSPIPFLEDVSPEEYEELKTAARQKRDVSGPRFGMALSKREPVTPEIYISSNLPDGLHFHIFYVGVPDTLLNQKAFSTQQEIVIKGKWVKAEPVRFTDGKPVPKGDYTVYLTVSDAQISQAKTTLALMQPLSKVVPEVPTTEKILAMKTYFLGGVRDATYISRLKDYHDKLRVNAANEINEIKQFSATLESQLASTNTKFGLIRKGKVTPRQRKSWEDFHNEWMKLEAVLDQSFQRWTPEAIQNEYFYGTLYQMTQQVGHSVEKVHGFQQGYFLGGQDPKTFEIQLGEASSSVQNEINLLKMKITQAEKLTPTPNGMPRREGL